MQIKLGEGNCKDGVDIFDRELRDSLYLQKQC